MIAIAGDTGSRHDIFLEAVAPPAECFEQECFDLGEVRDLMDRLENLGVTTMSVALTDNDASWIVRWEAGPPGAE
jgi:hypothetical protein